MKFEEYAAVGDVIECDVQNPAPSKLYAKLTTPEACAFGNELILSGRWKKTPPEIASTLTFGEPTDHFRKFMSTDFLRDIDQSIGGAS